MVQMPMIGRLVLATGSVLESGHAWPDDEAFVVGPIFFIRELAHEFREGGDGEEDAGDGAETSTTPAHYEVWQVPAPFLEAIYTNKFDFLEQSGMMQQIPALKCIRVWLEGNLLFAEENWPTEQAAIQIIERIKDQVTDSGLLEPGPNGSQAQAQSPQQQQQTSA